MKHSNIVLFSFALVLCLFIRISYAQFPSSVRNYMATRRMRYHHHMWHQVRGNWYNFDRSTQEEFRNLGWAPPNPLRDNDYNFAGEDFLFMHRHMVQEARRVGGSSSALQGWTSIPAPDDSNYPVPPAFRFGGVSNYFAEYKTQSHYESMKRQEQQLKDPNRLRGMTLNELGNRIEGSIHNSLHYRWSSASSVGYRTGYSTRRNTNVPYMDRQFDDPRYDWMGDSYASHVNPLFYKLHGWIDDRVEDWRRANGLDSIRWSGTWIGGPVSNLGSVVNKMTGGMHGMSSEDDPDAVGEVLEKAFEIFAKSGVPEVMMGQTIPPKNPQRRVLKTCKKKRRNLN